MHTARVLLFGDQTVEKLGAIRGLVSISRKSPTLRRFLQEAADVVQFEAAKFGAVERNAFSGCDTLLAMAEANAEREVADEAVATPLMCVARLGELLLYAEKDPEMLLPANSKVHIVGLCTGLLPAAAALMATDIAGLFKYGLEMVAISVRLGFEIKARSKRAEDVEGSWAYSMIGATAADVQTILDSFHERNSIPAYRQAYVAVISRSWTTIFGPPSTLARLWQHSPELGLAPRLKLLAGGAVHAPNLPPLDADKVIGQSDLLTSVVPTKSYIISSSTCNPYIAIDLRNLLRQMLADIGQNTLRLTDTIQKLVMEIGGHNNVDLFVVGPTAHTSMVQEALQSASMNVTVTRQADGSNSAHSTREGSGLIAIVGMSGRFPGGCESISQFWDILLQGQDVHETVPESRFDLKTHFDKDGGIRNSTLVPYGCFLQRPGLFDNRMFNISPREAAQMDPIQRLLLMSTYEALEMAGYNLNGSLSTDNKRIATYIGQATDDWRSNNESSGIDIYFIPGIARAFYPGRLNYHFKWEGGSYSLDSACASSSTAVISAAAALLSRECDTAIAGGGNLLTTPAIYAGLSRGGFLSKTGGCKTFRDDADGYCRGEGVGIVVLKRLEDALAENDNVLAIINGYARTHSAEAVSITQPHVDSQRRIYKKVFQRAGVDPRDIGYVEMHGTGTQAGDTTKMQSVFDTFCAGRAKDNPLYLGAVKANIGHGEAAAGVSSLIKSVLMLRERQIPPHPGMPFKVNHKFPPMEKKHMKIPAMSLPFDSHAKDGKRRVFLNNFDASGGNTSLIVEEFVDRRRKKRDPRSYHVLAFSGHTSSSLKENKKRLLHYLRTNQETKIADLAYTTTARRMQHYDFRTSFSAQTTQELIDKLVIDSEKSQSVGGNGHNPLGTLVWVFAGQGSSYFGMGKQLFQRCARFRESILSYQRICDLQGLPYIVELISGIEETRSREKSMVQMQLAIVFLELALADLWKSWGIRPDLLIGHSLGEYSALCVSGVLSITDTLYLVGKRSTILQNKSAPGTHAMLAVDSTSDNLDHVIKANRFSSCEVSCKNVTNQTVASGTVKDLKFLESHLNSTGAKTKWLHVPYGFHSAQVEPILDEFEACAQGVHFALPKLPVVSTLTATVVNSIGQFTSRYLARQAREPVNFLGALQTCKTKGLVDDRTAWIEFGPESTCLGMIRSSLGTPSTRLLATIKSTEENWKTTSASLSSAYMAKIPIDWKAYHQDYLESLTLLDVPAYAFDLKDFWSPYKQDLMGPDTLKSGIDNNTTPQIPATPLRTCLQHVVKESYQGESPSATFVSYTSEPNLLPVIQAHLITGVALCPASVFCDMAYSAAEIVYARMNPGKTPPVGMSIHDLEIIHPVVVHVPDPHQKIEIKATKAGPDWSVNICFGSGESPSRSYGSCQVRFGAREAWKRECSRSLYLVKKRLKAVVKSSLSGTGYRLPKPVVYKLFSDVVAYGETYQGLEEVFLDTEYREAVGRVKLRPKKDNGHFTQNPYWLDNLIHLAGFVLNGDVTKAGDVAFIATGFEVMYLIEELDVNEEYTSYVYIQDGEKQDTLLGDVYVFNGETVVAHCIGVLFQRMPKRTLAAILGMKSSDDSATRHQIHSAVSDGQKPPVEARNLKSAKVTPLATLTTGSTASKSSFPAGSGKRDSQDALSHLLDVIAAESGFSAEEMGPSTRFSDMGLDSIMSITIVSTAKSRLNLDLPASIFVDHPTVKDLQHELAGSKEGDDAPGTLHPSEPGILSDESSSDTPALSQGDTTSPVDDAHQIGSDITPFDRPSTPELHSTNPTSPKPQSKAVLLQGRASSTETPVYLATDGAGSAAAYIYLPALPDGRRIFALESPYLQNPTAFRCSVEEYCSLYVATIQECQPRGPYIIGGWSAGAVWAYEICRQLLHRGEQIKCLFMMDMRVPRPIPDALEPTHELIEQAGLITGIKRSGQIMSEIASHVKEHLVSTVRALTKFEPRPMDPARRPGRSFMVWSRRGVDDEKQSRFKLRFDKTEAIDPDANVMEDPSTGLKGWFFAKRTAFGPNGWDKLVGEIECHVVEADHFSMVTPPAVKELGKLLRMAVDKSEAAWKADSTVGNS